MPRSPAINLAKGRGQTFIDRFLNWALSIGRVIVIFTEFIALGAFIWRFGLDAKIIDLHSKINQEQIIVKLLNKNETTFRNLQDRLKLIKTLDHQALDTTTVITNLFSLASNTVTLEEISLTNDTLQLETSAQDPRMLAAFINHLKSSPNIINVHIDKVENKTTTATIIMSLTAKLRKITTSS